MKTKTVLKLFLVTLITTLCFAFSLQNNDAKASEVKKFNDNYKNVELNHNEVPEIENEDEVNQLLNPYPPFREKTGTSYSWSSYARVSDNLVGPGTIKTDRSKTFGVSYTNGRVPGLSLSGSKTSSVGYSFPVPAGKKAYIGYRVQYKNVTYRYCNSYNYNTRTCYTGWVKTTAKIPQHGEYALRYVN